MTLYFNIFNSFSKDNILRVLSLHNDARITAMYDACESETFDRTVMTDEEIADCIYATINDAQTELSEIMSNDHEITDDDLDRMYDEYCDSQTARDDALDAVLHHYMPA